MAVYCLSLFTLSNFDLADLDDTEFAALPDTCVWTMPPTVAAATIAVIGQVTGEVYAAGTVAGSGGV